MDKKTVEGTRSHWAVYPIVLVAAIVMAANVTLLAMDVAHRCPLNPWEPGIVADAWRILQGLPVYADVRDDHATHTYGPLLTYLVSWGIALTGVNNHVGRVIQLCSAAGLIALLIYTLVRRRPWYEITTAVGLLLAVNTRTFNFFAETRPDSIAFLFATAAVCLFCDAVAKDHMGKYLLGLGVLLLAFFFKQTAIIACAIPLLALLLHRESIARKRLIYYAFAPFVVVLAALVMLRLCAPTVYHYMMGVQSRYPILPAAVLRNSLDAVRYSPLFLISMGEWFISGDAWNKRDRKIWWAVAAILISLPATSLFSAKVGGAVNSQLAAFLAMTVFVILRLHRLFEPVVSPAFPLQMRLAAATFIGGVMFISSFTSFSSVLQFAKTPLGDDRYYPEVAAYVRTLNGNVISPLDPSILLQAGKKPGRAFFWDYDHTFFPSNMPSFMQEYIARADYIVMIATNRWVNVPDETLLHALHFEKTSVPALDGSPYSVWRKTPVSNGN